MTVSEGKGMMRLGLLISTAVLAISLVTQASADYFPANQGDYWIFSYTHRSYGWMWGGGTDSGTIRWDVLSVGRTKSIPAQVSIRILQTTRLVERRFSPDLGSTVPQDAYDSLLCPPRYTYDTLLLHGTDGVNGLWFEGDSCWSFVHDTSSAQVAGQVRATRDSVWIGTTPRRGVRINPLPCRAAGNLRDSSCLDPEYFICADSVGPIGYYAASSFCLMDAGWSELWTLIGSNLLGIDGGPCSYDRYPGTARILRIAPVSTDSMNTRYEAFFTFTPSGAAPQTLDLAREYGSSRIVSTAVPTSQLHLKPGHSYPCTLSTIVFGTCTPFPDFSLGVPQSWTGYDTSHAWIEPSAVKPDSSFVMHLLSDESPFTCYTSFARRSLVSTDTGIILEYQHNPILVDTACAPGLYLYGLRFSVPSLAVGTYPVYVMDWPPECPTCGMPYVVPVLIDTLVVSPASATLRPVVSTVRQTQVRAVRTARGMRVEVPAGFSGAVTIRVFDARGRMAGSARAVRPTSGVVDVPVGATSLRGGVCAVVISDGWTTVQLKVLLSGPLR